MTTLTPAQLATLKALLLTAPYVGLSDEAASDAIATADKSVDRESITSGDVVGCIAWAEYDVITAAQKAHLQLICSAPTVATTATVKAELGSMFPVGSTTRTKLTALMKRTGNRAEEAGLTFVPTPSQVADARRS